MDIKDLRKQNTLIDLFCTLAEIPSPSMGENDVATEIISTLKSNGIEAFQDDYSNVIARIPATDSSKKPMLLPQDPLSLLIITLSHSIFWNTPHSNYSYTIRFFSAPVKGTDGNIVEFVLLQKTNISQIRTR